MRKVVTIEPDDDGKFVAVVEVQEGEFRNGVLVGGLVEVGRQVFDSEETARLWVADFLVKPASHLPRPPV